MREAKRDDTLRREPSHHRDLSRWGVILAGNRGAALAVEKVAADCLVFNKGEA